MLRVFVIAVMASAAVAVVPPSLTQIGDSLLLRNGFVSATFNLTRGSLDILQGRFVGDGLFSSSPNLAGDVGAPPAVRRGALAVIVHGQPESSTASFDRAAPIPFTVLANTSSSAAFSVVLTDSASSPRVSVTLTLALTTDRALVVNVSATALAAFSSPLVALSTTWSAPDVVTWYLNRGVRQGMLMSSGYLASATGQWARFYAIGDGATGAIEARALSTPQPQSFMFAGAGAPLGTQGGLGVALWGAATPDESWVKDVGSGPAVPVASGAAAMPVSLALFPNDLSFPPSAVPPALPAGVVVDDLRSILTAVHGSPVSALHSYDYAPEVRAAPCLVIRDKQCYGPTTSYYDPDSGISNRCVWGGGHILMNRIALSGSCHLSDDTLEPKALFRTLAFIPELVHPSTLPCLV